MTVFLLRGSAGRGVLPSPTTLGRKNAIRFPFNVVRTLRAAQGDEIRGDLTN